MKRLVIIIDAMRYDALEMLNIERPHWALPSISFGDGTLPAFTEIARLVRNATVFTGGGYVSQVQWDKSIEVIDNRMFPLTNMEQEIIARLKNRDGLVIVHDYFVHNYWQDAGNTPAGIFKNVQLAKAAYDGRVRVMGQRINRFLSKVSSGWDVYVTADHGEVFKEDGVSFGHGKGARHHEKVYQIPVIGVGHVPVLNYAQLFSGRTLPRPVETDERLKELGYL